MRRAALLIMVGLGAALAGCGPNTTHDLAVCRMEGMRTYNRSNSERMDGLVGDYTYECMTAKGYRYGNNQKLCPIGSGDVGETSENCYDKPILGRFSDH